MRIITKRIRVIEMTTEEHAKFLDALKRAQEGHTSHYAEEALDDGTYLGVSIVKYHEDNHTNKAIPTEDNGSTRKPNFKNLR